jgi:GPI-anchor transamidase subunit S
LALLGSSPACDRQNLRVVQYAPRYRLAFSLLNEDAATGDYYAGWDIHRAFEGEL